MKEVKEKEEHSIVDEPVNIATGYNSSKLFRIAPVVLKGPEGTVEIFALFDEGSAVTMLEENVAKQIGLDGPTEKLCLSWMDDHGRTEMNSKKVSPKIAGNFASAHWWQMKEVRTVGEMKLPLQTIAVVAMKRRYPHLGNVPIKSMKNARPQLLIGIDHGKLTPHHEVAAGLGLEPIAVKTRLGWVMSGTGNDTSPLQNVLHVCETEHLKELDQLVKVKDWSKPGLFK
jgi:hypothetical protein